MRQPERFAKWPNEQDVLLLWGVVAIVAFQFMLGLYAVALNALFYTQYGPFYDSLSYDNALARMQLDARSDGAFAALSRAIYSDLPSRTPGFCLHQSRDLQSRRELSASGFKYLRRPGCSSQCFFTS